VNLWTESLARDLDLATDDTGAVQREILRTKPSLRRIYERIYDRMIHAARTYAPSMRVSVELGSGGGFLRAVVPDVVASDLRPTADLDLVLDAQALPFRTRSVDVLYAMHLFHHVPDVRRFLREIERVLVEGGVLVAVDPYWSGLAKVMFKHFHPEPFDERAAAWEFDSTSPMASNQALSYLVLERDREDFAREFPGLEVIEVDAFAGPSYLLTGGIWKRKLLPDAWLDRLWRLEERHDGFRRRVALQHLFVLRRRGG